MSNVKLNLERAAIFFMGLVVLLGSFEGFVVIKFLLSDPVMPAIVSQNAFSFAALAVGLFLLAFSYLKWPPLLSAALQPKMLLADLWTLRAGKLVAIYFALFYGMALTVVAFGTDGPFGEILSGIKGLRLPVEVKYWPLVFVAGAVIGWGIASNMLYKLGRARELGNKTQVYDG